MKPKRILFIGNLEKDICNDCEKAFYFLAESFLYNPLFDHNQDIQIDQVKGDLKIWKKRNKQEQTVPVRKILKL